MLTIIGAGAVGYAVATAGAFCVIRKGTSGTYRVDEDIKTAFLWPFMLALLALMLIFDVGADESAFDGKA